MSVRAVLLVLIALSAGMGGCDPCAGVIGCADGRYLAATGQIVDASTGVGIDGLRLDVVRTGGIQVVEDSVSAITSGGGFWRVELTADSVGTLVADIQLSAPDTKLYRLHGVRLDTKLHGGDANLNERWVTFLYFDYVGEFYIQGTADVRPQGATVEFRRTSGVPLVGQGVQGDVYQSPTNIAGRVHFFPTSGDSLVFAGDDGPVVGDLVVRLPGASDSTVTRGVQLTPQHTFRDRRDFPPVIRIGLSPSSTTSRR
jgi:hypothetical protein